MRGGGFDETFDLRVQVRHTEKQNISIILEGRVKHMNEGEKQNQKKIMTMSESEQEIRKQIK